MLEEKEDMEEAALALGTGGPRRAQPRVTLLIDAVGTSAATSNNPNVICSIGDLNEGPSRRKVLALWTEDCLGPRDDGRLHVQDASHLLEVDSQERFVSLAVVVCPRHTYSYEAEEYRGVEAEAEAGEGAGLNVVVVACSEVHMLRWVLRLDRDTHQLSQLQQRWQQRSKRVSDVGRLLQRDRPWASIPAPVVLDSTYLELPAPGSGCSLTDCNLPPRVDAANASSYDGYSEGLRRTEEADEGRVLPDDSWTTSLLLSTTIEGGVVVVRDARLSVVCRLKPPPDMHMQYDKVPAPGSPGSPSKQRVSPGMSSYTTAIAASLVNTGVNGDLPVVTATYERSGSISSSSVIIGWNIGPCVHVNADALENDEDFDMRLLQPVMLFRTLCDYEVSMLHAVPSSGRASGSGNNCSGRSASGKDLQVIVGGRDGKLRVLQANLDDDHSHYSHDDGANTDADYGGYGDVKEEGREIGSMIERYCFDLMRKTRYLDSSNSSSSSAVFTCLPLSVSMTGINTNTCMVVTSQAVLSMSLPDLRVFECVPLTEAGSMASGAAKALATSDACSFAALFVSAFDRQMRIYFPPPISSKHKEAVSAGASHGPRVARHLTGQSSLPPTEKKVINYDIGNGTNGLSLFVTAADLAVIDGTNQGGDDYGFSLGERGAAGGEGRPSPSPLAAKHKGPSVTPVALKGASGSGTNCSPGKTSAANGATRTWETPMKDKKSGKILNQPVTFHSRIKSSGYGQGGPQTALEKMEKKRKDRLAAARERSDRNRSSTAPAATSRLRQYPVTCSPISTHQAHNDFAAASTAGALNRIKYSSDGSTLGMCATDSTLSTIKLPVSRHAGDGTFYMSHDGTVTNIAFSHQRQADKQLLLSSSSDGTARIWRTGKVDYSAVAFTHDRCSNGSSILASTVSTGVGSGGMGAAVKASSGAAKAKAASARNRPFSGPVIDASFYYNDKFVSLANTNRVMLYSYSCDGTDEKNDLKRLQCNGSYKRVHEWSFPDTKAVTALSCVNSVLSPLQFCATSDRKLHVLDAARGTVSRVMDAPHERSIHCIALPQPSVFAQLDQAAYNTFATASMDNSILVWDLRAPTVTYRYTAHVNRREHVRCALSPCLRYMACGSEDKTARLVDLRTGGELMRFTGARDVVSDVAFHPITAQLAVASYDGGVKFYCSADENRS